MTRIIAISIPKGGTGKTTTTINLGAALAERGQRVLLVDFDPSGALTQALGVQAEGQTVYSAITAYLATYDPQLDAVIRQTAAGVDVVPADARLNLANGQLVAVQRGEYPHRPRADRGRPGGEHPASGSEPLGGGAGLPDFYARA